MWEFFFIIVVLADVQLWSKFWIRLIKNKFKLEVFNWFIFNVCSAKFSTMFELHFFLNHLKIILKLDHTFYFHIDKKSTLLKKPMLYSWLTCWTFVLQIETNIGVQYLHESLYKLSCKNEQDIMCNRILVIDSM